jgi:RNA polymerase II-associated protein 1
MSLIGDIVERKPSGSKPSAPSAVNDRGFPKVQHRSQSQFSKAREKKLAPRTENVPAIISANSATPVPVTGSDSWREDMERQNEARVSGLSEAERAKEIQDVRDQLGPGVADLIRKAREARLRRTDQGWSTLYYFGVVFKILSRCPGI